MIELEHLPLVGNEEMVARVIFPPKMIHEGHILPAAFVLRPSINEEYLSVLRISIPTFNADIKNIIYGRKRSFYGFAVLRTDEIHRVKVTDGVNTVQCSIRVVATDHFKSHAGIFIILNGQPVTGSMSFEQLPNGATQRFLLLAMRFRLTELADKGLVAF